MDSLLKIEFATLSPDIVDAYIIILFHNDGCRLIIFCQH